MPIYGDDRDNGREKLYFDKSKIEEVNKLQDSLPDDMKMTSRQMLIKILSTLMKAGE